MFWEYYKDVLEKVRHPEVSKKLNPACIEMFCKLLVNSLDISLREMMGVDDYDSPKLLEEEIALHEMVEHVEDQLENLKG